MVVNGLFSNLHFSVYGGTATFRTWNTEYLTKLKKQWVGAWFEQSLQ